MNKQENHPKVETMYGTFASFHKPRKNPDSKAVILAFDVPSLRKQIKVITAFPSVMEAIEDNSLSAGKSFYIEVLRNIGSSDKSATEPVTGFINEESGKWEEHKSSGYSLADLSVSTENAVSSANSYFNMDDAAKDVVNTVDEEQASKKAAFYQMMIGR